MKIEVLYPEIANLYGDLENISYLKRSCPEIEVVETHLSEEPLFVSEKPALVYMGTMTESAQLLAIEELNKYKEALKARIEDGTFFLITGNALELFGERIEDKNGTQAECLGLFPTTAKRDMMHRFNSLYLGSFKDGSSAGSASEDAVKTQEMTIVGYKSQFTHSYINGENQTFTSVFESKRGPGLNPDITGEGIRKNNFIATYIIGPILVLNPPFAKWVLSQMGVKQPELAFEEAAMKAYDVWVAEYSNPDTGFYY